MAKYLIIVESNCSDPIREGEFHDWYNNIHIPDILKTKGFIKATRYEVYEVTKSSGDKGRFLAIYEIETDNLDDLLKKHSTNMKEVKDQGRLSNLINSTSRVIYRQIRDK